MAEGARTPRNRAPERLDQHATAQIRDVGIRGLCVCVCVKSYILELLLKGGKPSYQEYKGGSFLPQSGKSFAKPSIAKPSLFGWG